jgi:hypothetical protein
MDTTNQHSAGWWEEFVFALDRYSRAARSGQETGSRAAGHCRECGQETESVVLWDKHRVVSLCPPCGRAIRGAPAAIVNGFEYVPQPYLGHGPRCNVRREIGQ